MQHEKMVGFVDAVKLFFKNYFNFSGNSTRAEYWWAMLFLLVAGVAGVIITEAVNVMVFLLILFLLAIIIPSISLTIRRFRDTGLSLWLLLLYAVPMLVVVADPNQQSPLLTFISIGSTIGAFIITLLPTGYVKNR